MKVEVQEIMIATERGYPIAAHRFSTENDIQKSLVISSATGVLQKFYSKFASFFAAQGFVVYTFDYCGIGNSGSSLSELKKNNVNLSDWGQNDQAAVVAFVRKDNPDAELTLIAHSIGGQLVGLNPNYHVLDKIIMVASQTGYWKYFKGIHKPKMWLFWYVVIPVLTSLFGYFPAKRLGLFENLPKNMVYEWAKWGRQKEYFMHFYNRKTYFFDALKIPILFLSFPDDIFAPEKAVDWLSDQYNNARITRVHYRSEKERKQPEHFGFFKPAFQETLWKQSLHWIQKGTWQ